MFQASGPNALVRTARDFEVKMLGFEMFGLRGGKTLLGGDWI